MLINHTCITWDNYECLALYSGYSLLVKLKNFEKRDATTGWLSSGLNGANSVSFDGEFMFLFILADTILLRTS